MCEPHHSIVQYPEYVDDKPTASILQAAISTRITVPDNTIVIPQGIRIGSHIHFSSMGKGHSESMAKLGIRRLHLPTDTKYETQWWDRKVKLDGYYYGEDYDREDALDSATVYANRVCIGNICKLRQFLESSLKFSDGAASYIRQFQELLTGKGWLAFEDKMRRILGGRNRFIPYFGPLPSGFEQQLINAALGMTRKRELLVPEWSDNSALWT